VTTKELDEAWKDLSPFQKEAAEWDEGPLLVLAGPGSGKTRVLTCRIARILDSTRDKKFRILGLTFTNKAADEMRTRVATYVPGEEGRLFLGTFHSFCADVLRQHGVHLNINPNFHIYSLENDLRAVLNDAVEEGKKLSDIVSDLDKKTLPVINRLKSLLIMPEQCRDVFKDKEFGERMSVVYPLYEAELSKRNALDFNSLIFQAYLLFTKFPAFSKRYRTVFPFVCIDEFQDTNLAQYKLIRAIAGDQFNNLFIVADDDQIIYQWNGASHKRIVEFINEYSPKVMQLPMNYRCPPEIVFLANNLIRYNFLRSPDKKPLEAYQPSRGKDTVRLLGPFADFETEAAEVARDIKKLHTHNLGAVVILGRSRKLLDGAYLALQKEKLPCVISQRKDEFESTPFVWIHSILRLANDRQNMEYLEAVSGTFYQLTGINLEPEEVDAQARAANNDYLQQWIKIANKMVLDKTTKAIIGQTSKFLSEGRDFKVFIKHALDWFRVLAGDEQVGSDPTSEIFIRYQEERTVWENLMREIIDSLGEDISLEAFLQELQMRSKEPVPKPNTIILMTIHGAKGKEFEHVYIIGLMEDEMPSFQSKKKGDDSPEMEEERRNCFVAITRTIKTLTLSFAERYRGWPKEPSRFLFEMGLL